MERLKFIGKRLVYLVIMLFGVATLVFILTKLVPGDPVTANLSQRALGDPQIVAAYKAKYGLDQPIIVQYVYYMKNLLHFDLGTSIRTNNAVLSELSRLLSGDDRIGSICHHSGNPVWYFIWCDFCD